MAEVRRRKPDEAGEESGGISLEANPGLSDAEKRNSSAAESSDHVSFNCGQHTYILYSLK